MSFARHHFTWALLLLGAACARGTEGPEGDVAGSTGTSSSATNSSSSVASSGAGGHGGAVSSSSVSSSTSGASSSSSSVASSGAGGSSTSTSGAGGGPVGDGLVLGAAVSTTVKGTFAQSTEMILRLVAGSAPPCAISGSPFFTQSHYAYVEVLNPNSQPAKVEIGVDPAPPQALELPLLAAYSAIPSTDAERKACLTGAGLSCTGGTASHESCLSSTQTPTVPAGGSIWIYVGNFASDDPAVSFILSAKILSLL